MSSHREAPEISKDPVADNTDTYAFVSPDKRSTVTIITNYIPLEDPPGGPNFFEFGDDVVYSIYVDNDGDALPDITYEFRFTTTLQNPGTFLYNTGPITSLTDPNWNKRQVYSVTRITNGHRHTIAHGLTCPPCNVGPRSTPNYARLASAAVHRLHGGEVVFAGQRRDPFFVDLGATFDLADIRPIQSHHLISTPNANSVDSLKAINVHSIAIQVPIRHLTSDGKAPRRFDAHNAVLGIWGAASRRKSRIINGDGTQTQTGPFVQVSRLGNPLFNEVIVPMGEKDAWNRSYPSKDARYLKHVQHPELAGLLPVLYPGAFPHLAKYHKPRADLVAILLTGIPKGIVPGFQNLTGNGKKYADMLRLNVAIKPTRHPRRLGLVGGDAAGFPNGRRLTDDIVAIELKAVAGATIPLVDRHYKPDAAVGIVDPGLLPGNRYLRRFPYVGTPHDGYHTPSS